MGSIPPAASIEYPQREVANFISRSGLTPSNADLTQLAQGVQNSLVNYAQDTGLASIYAVTLNPPPISYFNGMPIRMKVLNAPNGASTLNVNGLGARPLKKRNGAAVQPFDFFAGDILLMVYDGTNFQIIGAQATPLLAAPMIYYISPTGNDANDGLTSLTAFRTINKVVSEIIKFNLNGYQVTVYAANGSYAPGQLIALNGSGSVFFVGNSSSPSQVVINGALSPSGGGYALFCTGAGYHVSGFTFTTPGPTTGNVGAGIWLGSQGAMALYDSNFAACGAAGVPSSWWIANDGGYIALVGNINISGGTDVGFGAIVNGQIRTATPNKPTLSISAPVTVGVFALAAASGVDDNGWASITGYANVTGQKYSAGANGVVNVNGAGPAYLPGTIAGVTSTGGQYV